MSTSYPLLPGEYEPASLTEPVVTAVDMAGYMGIDFQQGQIVAVQDVIDSLTAELQRYLHVDLSINTWTEQYTVPCEAPDMFVGAFNATQLTDFFADTLVNNLGLGMATGPVQLSHAPVRSYLDMQVFVPWPTGPSATPYPGQLYNPDVDGGGDDPTLTVIGFTGASGIYNGASGTWVDYSQQFLPVPPGELPLFVWGTTVQVTYVAGYNGQLMPDIKGVLRRAAARELTNRLDDARGLRGPLSTERLPDGPGPSATVPGFTDAELKRLSRLRRRVIV